jgi:hypothetical protein
MKTRAVAVPAEPAKAEQIVRGMISSKVSKAVDKAGSLLVLQEKFEYSEKQAKAVLGLK